MMGLGEKVPFKNVSLGGWGRISGRTPVRMVANGLQRLSTSYKQITRGYQPDVKQSIRVQRLT